MVQLRGREVRLQVRVEALDVYGPTRLARGDGFPHRRPQFAATRQQTRGGRVARRPLGHALAQQPLADILIRRPMVDDLALAAGLGIEQVQRQMVAHLGSHCDRVLR